MTRRLLLVRHPPVDAAFAGVCYGASDVPLGADRRALLPALVAEILADGSPEAVYHSGLSRCRVLAEAVAERCGVKAVADPRLRERSFGAWELRPWDDIHAATGEAMLGMLTDPAGWRPPGGETTFELRDRVLDWHADLAPTGVVLAVTHGGPVAALVGTLRGLPVADWPKLIPPPGGLVSL
ncbi:MAG: histidine phosphatase family protein [Gemmataceae bacterium]|nr:histidine phosphatase family protein [Gemmataceae bacterium]